MFEKEAKEIYKQLRELYPNAYIVIRGRSYDPELFDFEVKTRKWFGKVLVKGDGLFGSPQGSVVWIHKGQTDELKQVFESLGYKVYEAD